MRARALWLMARLGDAKSTFQQAANDSDENVRATAIRIARQCNLPTRDYVPTLLGDASPVVLRELAIALREDTSKEMPEYWTNLALRFDGRDRWYLEALGIAATDRWDECLADYRDRVPSDRTNVAQRMIAWRGRGLIAAEMQSQWLASEKLDAEAMMALFRAVDFLSPDQRSTALRPVLESDSHPERVVEALMKLEGVNIDNSPRLSQLVRDYIEQLGNDPRQLKIVRKLRVSGLTDRLLERAAAWGPSTQSVQAIDMVLEAQGANKLWEWLSAKDPGETAQTLSKNLSLSNRREAIELQLKLLEDTEVDKSIRVEAAVGLSRNKNTHPALIELARADRLPSESRALIGSALRASDDADLRTAAENLFPMLKSNQNPLPPIDVLATKRGNPDKGRKLYFGASTCSQCHMVGKEGQNVGPSLTEIGDKLTREAMYVSILSPSAGISHNYEAYTARDSDEEVVTGLLVSKTASGVTLKDAKGIERTIPAGEIEEFRKMEKSLMPENLQETMSESDLVDIVEYLTTLRK
jgi:putative heme-binding domain-containing protein